MLYKDRHQAIQEAIENYKSAAGDHRIADFDVTAIEGLGVRVGVNQNNREGTLLTFELLRQMPEAERESLLRFISNGYGVNFGMPEDVTWERGIPESRNIFDVDLMD